MYKAEIRNGEFVVTCEGEVTNVNFNYFAEAVELAEELNREMMVEFLKERGDKISEMIKGDKE